MKKKIIIVTGDPLSINTEIINKVWKKINRHIQKKIVLIGNYNLVSSQLKKLKSKICLSKLEKLNDITKKNDLKIIDVPIKNSSQYIVDSLTLAHELALNKEKIKGIINCPINKRLIKSTNKLGVTEFLASKDKINNGSEIMMIYNKKLSVVPLTTHVNIKKIPIRIKSSLIVNKIKNLDKFYKNLFKKKPKIGILGLNPHNGEFNKKSEEVLQIIPAIKKLKKFGLKVSGPLVSDTAFVEKYKDFNIIVGMYHDQVLTPFKSLFHYDAINITLGLNYIRVSPDHGPAADLVGKNKANSLSLLKCIKFIDKLN